MSQLLQSGENIPIASFSGTIIVSHDIDHQLDINLTAFLLTEFGKVQDDRGVIFYNHPEDPSGVATFIPPENFGNTRNHKINFNLRRVPIGITKIAITLTEDKHSAGFAVTKNLKAEVHICEDIVTLIPSTFTTEKGIIVLELYIRNEQPKVKSVWQGFSSGLHGLCNYYGVQVEDDPCSSSAMPFNASSGSTSNMETLKNFELVKIALPTGKSGVGKAFLNIMEAEVYLNVFKKYTPISIYGVNKKNDFNAAPDIDNAREIIDRLNNFSDKAIDEFADSLIAICNRIFDEMHKKHYVFANKRDVFANKRDVFSFVNLKIVEINRTLREGRACNSFFLKIGGSEHMIVWKINDDNTLTLR